MLKSFPGWKCYGPGRRQGPEEVAWLEFERPGINGARAALARGNALDQNAPLGRIDVNKIHLVTTRAGPGDRGSGVFYQFPYLLYYVTDWSRFPTPYFAYYSVPCDALAEYTRIRRGAPTTKRPDFRRRNNHNNGA
jgi:hypothetical protein